MEVIQYEIVLINLDPTVGNEVRKTRPCVVISPDEMNDYLRTITIAPMTTKSRKYPTRVKAVHDDTIGWIMIDQIRTIDKRRIIKSSGKLTASEIAECKRVIRETYVD